jgi:triphosphatase
LPQREDIALRVRNDGGSVWLQTVKSDATLTGGLSSAKECEARLAACDPYLESIGELPRRIKRLLKNRSLNPIFETVIERSALELRKGRMRPRACLGCGQGGGGGGKSKPLREVELELRLGSIHDFLAVVRELFAGFNVWPSVANNAERGYRLLKGVAETNAPYYGKPVELSRGHTATEAFAAVLQAVARQIAANQRAVLEAGSPEGAHQMRAGLTRLRSRRGAWSLMTVPARTSP